MVAKYKRTSGLNTRHCCLAVTNIRTPTERTVTDGKNFRFPSRN
ncbi:hypothetical protein DSM3645_02598 [Blastopirellula marina DSM 3645]|uniref:Uncharacterized protein n=1 Tax=Blastopirellula marina DSM 3645 TaxID=314230 RepID=A3ZVI3_9BACT|nr:hypothetical protein DSM3645_02598 [Blastopirellula marina DSM 3645]